MADTGETGSVIIKTKLDTSEMDRSIDHIKAQLSSLSEAFEANSTRINQSTKKIKESVNKVAGNITQKTDAVSRDVKEKALDAAEVAKNALKNVTADGVKGVPRNAKALTDTVAMKAMPVIPKEYNPIPLQYRLAAKGIIKAGTALTDFIRKSRDAKLSTEEFTRVLRRSDDDAEQYSNAIQKAFANMKGMLHFSGKGKIKTPIEGKLESEETVVGDIEGKGEIQWLSKFGAAAEKLKDTFSQLARIATVPFQKLGKLLKPLTKSLLKFGKVVAAPFKAMTGSIKNFIEGFREKGLLNFFGELGQDVEGVLFLFSGGGLLEKFTDIGSTLTEVQNVVDVTFEEMSDKINDFAKNAYKSFGLSETMAKQFAGTLGAMAKSFGFTTDQAVEMSRNLTALAGDVASFYNLDQEEAYNKLKSVFTGETQAIKSLGIAMTQAALEEYAQSKGITKKINKMTEAEKVALRYNFVLEKLSGATGDFTRTSQTWANQTRLLKLQFESLMSTIGQGFINVFNPALIAINKILEGLGRLAEAFRKFTVRIMGGEIEETTSGQGAAAMAAGEAMGYLADETEAETDATKEAEEANKRYLSGLDEIARWSDKDDDKEDAMMDIAPFESSLDDADKTIEYYDSIPAKINAFLKKAYEAFQEWQPKIIKFLEELGDKFNDFIDKIDWEQLGKTLGAGLNLLVKSINAFVDTVDWVNLGARLADAFNSLLGEVDWYELGRFLGNKIKILTDMFYGFVTNIDWGSLGRAIADALMGFLSRIEWDKIAGTLIALLNGIPDAIDEFIRTYQWGLLADKLAWAVNSIFDPDTGVDWHHLGQSIQTLINRIAQELTRFIEGINWRNIGAGIADFFNGILDAFDPQTMADLLNAALQAFFDLVDSFTQTLKWEEIAFWITETIKKTLAEAKPEEWVWSVTNLLNEVFKTFKRIGENMPWRLIGNLIGRAIRKFFETADFAGWVATLTTWLNGILALLDETGRTIPWKEVGSAIGTSIATFFATADFRSWGVTLNTWIQGLLDAIIEATDPDKQDYQAIGNAIGDFIAGIDWIEALTKVGTVIKNVLIGIFQAMFKKDDENENPAAAFTNSFLKAIGALGLVAGVAGLFGKGSALYSAFSVLASHPILTSAGAIIAVTEALGGFDDIDVDWGALKDSIGGAFEKIGTTFAENIDGDAMQKALENIAGAIGTLVGAIAAITPDIISAIGDLFSLFALLISWGVDAVSGIINAIADAFRALTDSPLVQGIIDLNEALNDFFGGTKSIEERTESLDGYTYSLGKLAEFGDETAFAEVKEAIKGLSETGLYDPTTLDMLTVALDDATKNGDTFNSVMGYIGDVLTQADVPVYEFNGYISDTVEGLDLVGTNSEKAAEGIGKMQTVAKDTAESAGSIGELLSSLEESTDISDYEKLTALIGALQETASNTGDTDGKLVGLADQMKSVQQNDGNFSGYMDDIAEKLETAGVSSDTFKKALIKAIEKMGASVPEELKKVDTSISDFAPTIENGGAKDVGEAIPKGEAKAVKDNEDIVIGQAEDTTENTIEAIDKEFDIRNGESEKTKKSGKAAIKGTASGMKSEEGNLEKATEESADIVIEVFEEEYDIKGNESQVAKKQGETYVASGEAGMSSKKGSLMATSKDIADDAHKAFQDALSASNGTNVGNTFMDALAQAIEGHRDAMGTAIHNALQPVEDAFNSFSGKSSVMFDGAKAAMNVFISNLNSLLYGVQTFQNEVARLLSFSIDLPLDVAQRVGYSGFNLNIPPLTTNYQIPFLASGAVIPPNSPFMAVLGDQKSGTNVEAPLATIEQAVLNAMAKGGGSGQQKITVVLDRRVLFDTVIQAGRDALIQTGSNAFEMG